MLTLKKFKKLSALQQEEKIWELGVLLDKSEDGAFKIMLFQLDSFYKELYYNLHLNDIHCIKGFGSTIKLKPYLDRVDISSIYHLLA